MRTDIKTVCPICREIHDTGRGLSFDGVGINSCGMYRDRIATLPEQYRPLGKLLETAPLLLQTLKDAREVLAVALAWPNSEKIRRQINNAIAQAESK